MLDGKEKLDTLLKVLSICWILLQIAYKIMDIISGEDKDNKGDK